MSNSGQGGFCLLGPLSTTTAGTGTPHSGKLDDDPDAAVFIGVRLHAGVLLLGCLLCYRSNVSGGQLLCAVDRGLAIAATDGRQR
jgi:hypothetical protein